MHWFDHFLTNLSKYLWIKTGDRHYHFVEPWFMDIPFCRMETVYHNHFVAQKARQVQNGPLRPHPGNGNGDFFLHAHILITCYFYNYHYYCWYCYLLYCICIMCRLVSLVPLTWPLWSQGREDGSLTVDFNRFQERLEKLRRWCGNDGSYYVLLHVMTYI